MEGHKKNGNKKGDPKVKCLLVTKREKWVKFLQTRGDNTTTALYTDDDKHDMTTTRQTQAEVRENIAKIITTPNMAWSRRKQSNRYKVPRNYFGQYA